MLSLSDIQLNPDCQIVNDERKLRNISGAISLKVAELLRAVGTYNTAM